MARRRRRLPGGTPSASLSASGAFRNRKAIEKDAAGEPSNTTAILPYDHHKTVTELLARPEIRPFRDGEYFHVSDLIHKCPRMIAICKTRNIKLPDQVIHSSSGLTFAQGEAMAGYVVHKMSKSHPRNVYGIWSCACGHTSIEGTYKQAADHHTCSKCGSGLGRYHELSVQNMEHRLSGSIDLVIRVDGGLHIVEIKSIKKEAWEELERPVPDHILQVLTYWWLLKEQGRHILHDKVSILYMNKSFMFKNPFIEFVLQPSKMLHRIEELRADSLELANCVYKGGSLPIRTFCATPQASIAKQCPCVEECFADES